MGFSGIGLGWEGKGGGVDTSCDGCGPRALDAGSGSVGFMCGSGMR